MQISKKELIKKLEAVKPGLNQVWQLIRIS